MLTLPFSKQVNLLIPVKKLSKKLLWVNYKSSKPARINWCGGKKNG